MVSGRRSIMSSSSQIAGTTSNNRYHQLPPVASKAKDYTDRPEEVLDELDELRTRGIAKVLNKHFTDTTKQIAKEKAQADAALADLERRRAQTKEFKPSNGSELNPYDQLYLQLQQKRTECRRKERETMLLYQRYVMKYGKSAKVSSPVRAIKEEVIEKEVHAHTTRSDPPGKSPSGALHTLDENTEINFSEREMDITPKKAGSSQLKEQEWKKKQRQEKEAVKVNHFMSALNKFMTDDSNSKTAMASNNTDEEKFKTSDNVDYSTPDLTSTEHLSNEIEDEVERQNENHAPQVNKFMSAVSNFMKPENTQVNDVDESSEEHEEVEEELAEIEEKRMEEDIVPVEQDNQGKLMESEPIEDTKSPPPQLETTKTQVAEAEGSLVHTDDLPPIVASTDLSEAVTTAEVPISKSVTMESSIDPVTPDRPIAKSASLTSATACITPDLIPNTETPSFTTTTVDEEADDRSMISGLTSVNSVVTRQVMDEIETEMEDFIRTETDAIRKMLDSEEENTVSNYTSFADSSSSLLGDESVRVALKAEAMAREMQKILDEFEQEDASVSGSVSGDAIHDEDDEVVEGNRYPYKFEPVIPGEDWYVYYDDNYQRKFYVEKKSNRTQWDYPSSVPSPRADLAITSDEFLSDMQSVASSRGSLSRRSSRRSLYRRQRRKRRVRRLMMSFFTLFCVLVAVFHWRMNYPGMTFSSAMFATLANLRGLKMEDHVTYVKDQLEYAFTDRKQREEEERARLFVKAQQDRMARENAARRAKAEAERKEREEIEKLLRKKAAFEDGARHEAEKALEEQKKEVKADKKGRKRAKREKKEPRPWGCNIPFSFIVRRCNLLAKENPPFDEFDLVFLQ